MKALGSFNRSSEASKDCGQRLPRRDRDRLQSLLRGIERSRIWMRYMKALWQLQSLLRGIERLRAAALHPRRLGRASIAPQRHRKRWRGEAVPSSWVRGIERAPSARIAASATGFNRSSEASKARALRASIAPQRHRKRSGATRPGVGSTSFNRSSEASKDETARRAASGEPARLQSLLRGIESLALRATSVAEIRLQSLLRGIESIGVGVQQGDGSGASIAPQRHRKKEPASRMVVMARASIAPQRHRKQPTLRPWRRRVALQSLLRGIERPGSPTTSTCSRASIAPQRHRKVGPGAVRAARPPGFNRSSEASKGG